MSFQALTSSSPREALRWVEIADRRLRPDEVRVEVRAAGVNPVDWKMRDGDLMGVAQRVIGPAGTLVCGVDFAGTVSEVGSAVSDLAMGDRVVGGTDFSRRQYGSYARRVQVRADQVAPLPPEVSLDAAACLPVAGITARAALHGHGQLDRRQGARVLVLGASGGMGHFAIQLARIGGAVAVGVCSARNVALVERLGAVPIDYTAGDALAAAGAHGPFDIIVDGVGTASYPVPACRKLLAKGGVHVLVMPRPRDYWRIAVAATIRTVIGRPERRGLERLVAELAAGRLQVEIAERIPFDDAERAHHISRTGKVAGKLVLVA